MLASEQQIILGILADRHPKRRDELLDPNFPEQKGFIEDPSRLKALFCTRRAAKSYTAGLYMVREALENPGCNCLFLGLTRLSAKGIIWKDILKQINRLHDLGMVFNESEMTATLPNGSVIWITGADADESEMDKLLGRKYRLVCLDEGSLWTVDMRRLVYGILKPAVADHRGTICMFGTASDITQGLFFDITTGEEAGWKLFQWSAHDNPYIAKQWAEELEEIRTQRPLFMDTALYHQWYLNEWEVDTNKLVYRFNPARNLYMSLPLLPPAGWQMVLGVDLGYSPDPSAFSLLAFHENDPRLFGRRSYSRLEMDVTDVANEIKALQKAHPQIFRVVIDGSNKQAVQEIQRRHNLSLTAADKREKADFIEIMNSEMIQGILQFDAVENEELLTEEYPKLIWQTEGDKIALPRREHPGLKNHIADATLYGWRFCYQYLAEKREKAVNPRDRDAYRLHTEKMMEEALERQIEHELAAEAEASFVEMNSMADDEMLSHFVSKKRRAR